MAKLAVTIILLSYIVSLATAKLSYYPVDLDNALYDLEPEQEVGHLESSSSEQDGGILWAMDVNSDLNSIHLRKATADEEIDFEDFMEPRRASLEKKLQLASTTRRNTASDLDSVTVKSLQNDIRRNVNKFLMSIREESDAYLRDSVTDDEVPTLTFYLKAGLTLLTVTSSHQQWHYVIGPPAPLPAWLHSPPAPAPGGTRVEIPGPVKIELYSALVKLFEKMNRVLV